MERSGSRCAPNLGSTFLHIMATNGAHSQEALAAQYSSPTGQKEFKHELTSRCPPNATVAEKTAYLSELRSSTKKLQESINTFLTEKMEEDKAQSAGKGTRKAQDEVEEENYGEEVVDED